MSSCRQYTGFSRRLIGFHLLLIGFLCPCEVQADEEETAAVVARVYEQMTSNSETDIDFTTLQEDLTYFSRNPINLNSTTKEELDRLQFLSDQQVENLLYYLYRNSPMQTIYELQLVEGFDLFLIRNLLPFVTVGSVVPQPKRLPSLGKIIRYGKNELLLHTDRTLEKKKGYAKTDDEVAARQNNKKYVGDPDYLSLRYSFRYRDQIEAGFIGEKDPGEQFWGSYHKGFDFYSAYFQLNNAGLLKSLVVGSFNANFGQGLVIHPEMVYGKSGDVMNVVPRNSDIRKTSSTDEYNFMRGIGTTLKLGKWKISAFYSFRYIDGDSTGNGFSSLKTTGLHRTVSDLAQKNTIWMQVMGGNVSYRFSNLHLGLTATDTRFSRALIPASRPDNIFRFRGDHQLATGLNYQYKWKKFHFFGETATQSEGGMATIDGFMVNPVSTVSIVGLYRYYSKQYDVLLSSAFAEGSRVNNEEGFYLGVEVHPVRKWKISAYADSYSFPWLNYLVSRPTVGYDWMCTAGFMPSRRMEMYWRVRYKQKEKNIPTDGTLYYTGAYDKISLRYYLTYSFNNRLSLKNIVEINRTTAEPSSPGYGTMVSQELSYTLRKVPVSFDLRYELFDAVNYNNRFYSYEKDLLYVFSVPMLYGKGSRYYFNGKWTINKTVALWFKIAQSYYSDTETIGSGLESIQGNCKTDARAMIRIKL